MTFPNASRRIVAGVMLAAATLATGQANASCWTPQEKSIWATDEMEGTLTLSFRNALNCKPVANAKIVIGDQETLTDAAGLVRFPAPTGLDDVAVPIAASAAGYQRAKGFLVFAFNAPLQNRFLMSPSLTADRARFVLSWADAPRDLDLHLIGPGFHVSYQDMRNVPNEARLDRDAMNGHGPETITANRIRPDARYEVWVHNYSNDKPISKGAQVQIYLADGTTEAVVLPATTSRWVKVADIDQGRLTVAAQAAATGPSRR
jgi:hypothetical protein